MKQRAILITILLIASFLRLWRLDEVPVSLFGDELDVGYHAFSILKTGRDYQGNFLPIHFHSLAEWRTPLYLYSSVPTVAIFGISPLGVRLPAAIFGILCVWALYLLVKELFNDERLAQLSAFVLALSPWHIQYSRAAFEVTELLLFLILGLYFFLKALKNGKWLWVSSLFFAFTPWIYSTAKLFTPIFIIILILLWNKKLLSLSKKYIAYAIVVFVVVGAPIAINTVLGGGTERFGYVSVFTDPNMETGIGVARLVDESVRGSSGLQERILHNKYTFWNSKIISNYFEAFSTDFLFIKGDPNLRHSIGGMGEFYIVEAIALIFGIVLFFTSKVDRKAKLVVIFWILFGVLPSSITRDGGNHASRLILILPPLVFLMAYGISKLNSKLIIAYGLLLAANFVFYQHDYWVHNPWKSERWWHAGFKEAIYSIKEMQGDYDKVVITTANEPPWIFFAGWYEYPPDQWQANFPIGNDANLVGFGKVSHIDKFYFGSPDSGGFYSWGKVIDNHTLYLASEKEVNVNLIKEPGRTPSDLVLLKSIAYPSGEPAFYLFTGLNK